MRARIGSILMAAAALFGVAAPAGAQTAKISWYAQAVVKMSLTPNYAAGYGAVKAVFGAQPAPQHGPDVVQNAVDFGPVLAGNNYLYKYAAKLAIYTNDLNGFNLYGEGAADFTNQTDGSTAMLSQTLYYLNSVDGVTQSDTNTGYSPAFPFYATTASVTPMNPSTPPTITYASYPPPLVSTTSNNVNFYYDYELKVPGTATNGDYYVWVVYTVVPQ